MMMSTEGVKTPPKGVKLKDLNASLIGETVVIECQLQGVTRQKVYAREISWVCPVCGRGTPTKGSLFEEPWSGGKCKDCGKYLIKERTDLRDYALLSVRDILKKENLEEHQYVSMTVYFIDSPFTISPGKNIRITGKVDIEPKKKDITIIATEVEMMKSEIDNFEISEELTEAWGGFFNHLSLDVHLDINPDIVGEKREIAKEAVVLLLHSPPRIRNLTRNKEIRGGLRLVFFGDSKTGKSEISKDVTDIGHFRFGEYVSAETGSRTGILYSIDTEKGIIQWGSLPLNDLKLVVIDAAQDVKEDEAGEFLEALEQQMVIVRRSVRDDALARTRTIVCYNPYKPLCDYLYPCMAISQCGMFKKTQSLTRHDVFIPFDQGDVGIRELTHRIPLERKVPAGVFTSHVYWVWSRLPDQIIYTEPAVKEVMDLAEGFLKDYSLQKLPIVHNGVTDILLRLSVAYAAVHHSTDNSHEKIILETDHVRRAAAFYSKVLDLCKIGEFKLEVDGKTNLTRSEFYQVAKSLGPLEFKIMEALKMGEAASSTTLADELDISTRSVKERYGILKQSGLIEAKPRKGITLTPKGIKFLKIGLEEGITTSTGSITPPSPSERPQRTLENCVPFIQEGDQEPTRDPASISLAEWRELITGFIRHQTHNKGDPWISKDLIIEQCHKKFGSPEGDTVGVLNLLSGAGDLLFHEIKDSYTVNGGL